MENKINKLKNTCIAIINYGAAHPGALNPQTEADVKAMLVRLGEIGSNQYDSHESKTAARIELNDATEALKELILRSRRFLEAFAVGKPNGPGLPKGDNVSFFPSRIQAFALAHVADLEKLPGEPPIDKAITDLKAATATFADAYAKARSERKDLTDCTVFAEEEVASISGKLYGYRTVIASSVPRKSRHDLMTLIRSNVPAEPSHKKAAPDGIEATPSVRRDPAEPAQPAAQPQTLPAIPAVSTAVPPSTEHPVVSATA